jgi:hypothetical protein
LMFRENIVLTIFIRPAGLEFRSKQER